MTRGSSPLRPGHGRLPSLLALLLLLSLAHPRHATLAEVAYVPERGLLEVALQVETRALERELSRGRRSLLELSEDGDSDALLAGYVARHFLVWRPEDERRGARPPCPAPAPALARRASEGASSANAPPRRAPSRMERTPLRWVGFEFEGRHAWLYFEVPLAGGLDRARFSNRMFLATERHQINTLIVSRGGDRATLVCTRARPKAVLHEVDLVPPRRVR